MIHLAVMMAVNQVQHDKFEIEDQVIRQLIYLFDTIIKNLRTSILIDYFVGLHSHRFQVNYLYIH